MAQPIASFPGSFFLPDSRARENSVSRQPGLLRRLGDAVIESRRKRAEAVIGRYIERQGGRLTDDMERQIERRFGPSLER
jgi:hypothetical protein